MNEPIRIQADYELLGYTFEPGYTEGMIWMYHESGEGMEVPEATLKAALDKFYSDNF
jgi:hypothetical protein